MKKNQPAAQTEKSDSDRNNGYVTGTWSGLPHFQCSECPYDTLDEADMKKHRTSAHSAAGAEPTSTTDQE